MRCSRLLLIVMGYLFMSDQAFAGLEVFVYPSKGQTKGQQEQDEGEASVGRSPLPWQGRSH